MFTLRSLAVLLVVALQAVLLVSSTSGYFFLAVSSIDCNQYACLTFGLPALALRDSAAFVAPSVSGKSCMPLSM